MFKFTLAEWESELQSLQEAWESLRIRDDEYVALGAWADEQVPMLLFLASQLVQTLHIERGGAERAEKLDAEVSKLNEKVRVLEYARACEMPAQKLREIVGWALDLKRLEDEVQRQAKTIEWMRRSMERKDRRIIELSKSLAGPEAD